MSETRSLDKPNFEVKNQVDESKLRLYLEDLSSKKYLGILANYCRALIPLIGTRFTKKQIEQKFPGFLHQHITDLNGFMKKDTGYRVLQVKENGKWQYGLYEFIKK